MNKLKLLEKIAHINSLKSQNKISLPKAVKIFEVGPRDGLQNEKTIIPTAFKLKMIHSLVETGISQIEIGSFVSNKSVSQMSDTDEIASKLLKNPSIRYTALVPNVKGLERAISCSIRDIAIFTAVSESFTQKNINCSIKESLERFQPIMETASKNNINVRGYISCVMGCPYEGEVDLSKINELCHKLIQMGCYEVSLGDTIGVGTPEKTRRLIEGISIPREKLAVHFHDTFGNALENILVALEMGVNVIDCSVGGLGGCPYAKRSVGNVCTENVVEMLDHLDISSGIDLTKLKEVSREVRSLLNREVTYLYD